MPYRHFATFARAFGLFGCSSPSDSPTPEAQSEVDSDTPQERTSVETSGSDTSDGTPEATGPSDAQGGAPEVGDTQADISPEPAHDDIITDETSLEDTAAEDSETSDTADPDAEPPPGDVPLTSDVSAAAPWDALPLCQGGVIDAALAPQLPKSAGADAFTPWSGEGWEGITGLITILQSGEIAGALEALAAVAYTACRGQGDEEGLVLFTPTETGTGHARAVWRLGPARALVLEAPHPVFDMDTGSESATLFESTQARGLIVSGTHRCVSDEPSECDGKTKVCTGSSDPYPLTDMAHVGVSFFQAFHQAFQAGLEELATATDDWEYLLLSVHGMAGDGISLSNGTSDEADVESLPAKLYLALKDALPDAYVTSCNSFDGAVVDLRLCGTTNTQGRHTNGVGAVCTTAAPAASGQFAHMEQTLEIRQNPEPVIQALSAVLSLVD